MSLADLRKELKDLRKKAMPTPVSRMKKADCAAELARLRGHHAKEEVKVAEVMKEEKVAKPVAKKVTAVQKESHKKEEEDVYVPSKSIKKAAPKEEEAPKKKAETPAKKVVKSEEAPKKPAKGSEEMRDRMKKLREMRKSKE
jgi:hypothetical protein